MCIMHVPSGSAESEPSGLSMRSCSLTNAACSGYRFYIKTTSPLRTTSQGRTYPTMTGHVDKKKRVHPGESPVVGSLLDGRNHQVLQEFKVPGLVVSSYIFKAPLDYSGEVPGEINLFVRELTSPSGAKKNQPFLLYLQGGPGFESPRPTEANGWIKTAVSSFRVVLLDQRGTGRSSQITANNLKQGRTPEQQAAYLNFFRADSIVRDAELVRTSLVPQENCGGRWSILGQSFGGFCAFTYMSFAPEGLLEVMITGGIPPGIHMPCSADTAYRSLYQRVLQANTRYYTRFPGDVAVVHRIVSFLSAQPDGGVRLSCGTLLTPRLLQTLGLAGLGSGGGFERLHYLLETFFDTDDEDPLACINPTFIKTFQSWQAWDTNPLYALLHESIYCQGAASGWAAHRVREAEFQAVFDAVECAKTGQPVMFTGEMVFPWMFEDVALLRPYREAAHLLAAKADWGQLYSTVALNTNNIPVAAATYVEDMYVDYGLAQASASHVRDMRQWHTSEYKHSGIRDDGSRILERLLNMVRDTILLE